MSLVQLHPVPQSSGLAASRYVRVPHAQIRRVEREIFFAPFVSDCLSHQCRCSDGSQQLNLDACCQYGVDVDLFERDRILLHSDEIRPILDSSFQDPKLWFDDSEPEEDDLFPSGVVVRTAVAGEEESSGCVFLQHDQRGCALHLAAAHHGWDPGWIKPVVCTLYPLSFDSAGICLSDDFRRYSCAYGAGPESVYQVMRQTIATVFGAEVARLLDDIEAELVSDPMPCVS